MRSAVLPGKNLLRQNLWTVAILSKTGREQRESLNPKLRIHSLLSGVCVNFVPNAHGTMVGEGTGGCSVEKVTEGSPPRMPWEAEYSPPLSLTHTAASTLNSIYA